MLAEEIAAGSDGLKKLISQNGNQKNDVKALRSFQIFSSYPYLKQYIIYFD